MSLIIFVDVLQCTVNDVEFPEFKHRLKGIDKVRYFETSGDIILHKVKIDCEEES